MLFIWHDGMVGGFLSFWELKIVGLFPDVSGGSSSDSIINFLFMIPFLSGGRF